MINQQIRLTPREQQVLEILVERGATNKQIARSMRIVESTVKLHMTRILKKYGAKNRTQLMIFARKD